LSQKPSADPKRLFDLMQFAHPKAYRHPQAFAARNFRAARRRYMRVGLADGTAAMNLFDCRACKVSNPRS
jgi:hypothetical protein